MFKKTGLGAIAIALALFILSINIVFAEQGEVPVLKQLLQYRAGGHIIGFMPDKVYFAAPDHALSMEFIDGSGKEPHEINSSGMGDVKGPKYIGRVEYKNLWPGITLRYEKTDRGIVESTYLVDAGADVNKIRLKYNVPVTLRTDGTLKFSVSNGYLTESRPVAWQEINGKRQAVDVVFSVRDGMAGFQVSKYDRTLPLVIDPTYQYEPNYDWHTFYGAPSGIYDGDVSASGIAIDGSGNLYLTGVSYADWGGSPLNAFNGNLDCPNFFILKLTPSGAYVWHTFYGSGQGDFGDYANGIAVDRSDNVYVTGYTSPSYTWVGPSGQAPLNPNGTGGGAHLFILKLDGNGNYQWHTFYGNGSLYGVKAHGIAIDGASGNVSVTGYSEGTWNGPSNATYPAGVPPLNTVTPANMFSFDDIFVLTLNSSGAYQWHTFYGSGIADWAYGIAIDGSSNIYLTGGSFDTWNGPSNSTYPAGVPPINSFNAFSEATFVLKLNSSGDYQWHTFYGNDEAVANAIAIDQTSGNVAVTGYSLYDESQGYWNGPSNVTYPAGVPPLYSPAIPGTDVFILELSSSGVYQWHTFYGPGLYANTSDTDQSYSISINSSGDISVTGWSYESWNGPAGQSPANPFAGATSNMSILTLNKSGAYQWHSFYGSGTGDYTEGIAIDGGGNTYVAGSSNASWTVPLASGTSPLNPFAGQKVNMCVLKLGLTVCSDSPAQIARTPGTYYNSIQLAYAAAQNGDTIQLQALGECYFYDLPSGNLNLNGNFAITLQGGNECGFQSNPGFSIFNGSLTISGGATVTIENLIIAGPCA